MTSSEKAEQNGERFGNNVILEEEGEQVDDPSDQE